MKFKGARYVIYALGIALTVPMISQAQQKGDAQQPGGAPEIPAWVLADWASRTRDTDIWITDNATYKSEQAPYDAYGLRWQYGLGKKHMKGELYGIIDGKDSRTFWQFTEFWEPAFGQLRVVQIGSNGTVGQGRIWREEDGSIKEQQTFTAPGGVSFSTGHHVWKKNGDSHTQSFNIVDGKWEKRRLYIWKLQKDQASSQREVDVPDDYKNMEYLIGTWQLQLNDSMSVRMSFRWAENQRMIYYRSSNPARPGAEASSEAEGVISYHGVKDQVVFMNAYLKKGSHLMQRDTMNFQKMGLSSVILFVTTNMVSACPGALEQPHRWAEAAFSSNKSGPLWVKIRLRGIFTGKRPGNGNTRLRTMTIRISKRLGSAFSKRHLKLAVPLFYCMLRRTTPLNRRPPGRV